MKNLPRTFIYRDRKELDDFLKDNPLNDAIYDVFLEVKDSYYNLKVSAEVIFNEVYYQCTRLMLDPHPETRVKFYLDDAKDNIGTRYASDLVFSMVYAVLSLQHDSGQSIKRFLRCLEGKNLNICYFLAFKAMANRSKCEYITDFSPSPEIPERLFVHRPFIWSVVTDDYNQDRIRMIVNLWSSKKDKLAVLKMMEDAFDFDEAFKGNQTFFPLCDGNIDTDDLPF